MKTKKLALLIGHNEKEKGAANEDVNEYDYNSVLAKMICAKIKRDSPIYPGVFYRDGTLSKGEELSSVVADINEWGPDLTIELHLNSFISQKACGTEILIAGNMPAFGFNLPGVLLDGVTAVLGTRNRGAKVIREGEKGWSIQSNLKGERLLLESFFLSSPSDLKAGLEKKEELAEVIAQVVIDYLGGENG